MADTNDTTPGALPGALKTGADGSLPDLGGRRAWVWMQDSEEGGGGRFDVLSHRVDMWHRKGARVVPNYPLHFGPSGRLARPRFNLGGTATAGAPTVGDDTPADEQPPADPTLALPASALGAVEPASDVEDARLDTAPADAGEVEDPRLATAPANAGEVDDERLATVPADAGEQETDQADGKPAAAKSTTTRKAGRTR